MSMSQVIESKYSDALLASAREVFETMVMMTPRQATAIPDPGAVVTADVVGVLGFSGTHSGVGVMSCSLELARTICANMLAMDPSEIEDEQEIHDAFGEVVNMVLGSFKNAWVDGGNQINLAIPSISVGTGVSLLTCKGSNVVGYSVVLEFEGGDIRIDLRFEGK